ncbi:hypothetical protein CAMGR0001_1073 [Campylobacter gracilis RM3268]|uniref:Uncharacterized protein n=1 Tax=Campylobacter gracilis RM3268 TaxID=553220 RepID=C8PGS7_9BACT|nr:hypothetical protein CAMGR0001_1073 [Campylobacter gracilis RM3268]
MQSVSAMHPRLNFKSRLANFLKFTSSFGALQILAIQRRL